MRIFEYSAEGIHEPSLQAVLVSDAVVAKQAILNHLEFFQLSPLMSQDPSKNPYESPIKAEQQVYARPTQEGDSTGGVIPYKNPKALIAYYVGIASLLIFPLGVVSIVLGFMGLAARKRNPVIKGSVHAWIGIVLGGAALLCGGAFSILAILAILG
ncbi:MAG: hypothetical protein ACI87E_003961 [Mariniblastus sp.]